MIKRVDNVTPHDMYVAESPADISSACAGDNDMESFRAGLRRFTERFAKLPIDFTSTCPTCGQISPGRFELAGGKVMLVCDCPKCGRSRQTHFDAVWTDTPSDFPGSAKKTFHGARVQPIMRRLPRTTQSICPECAAVIPARIFIRDGKVWMEKSCPDHGYFRDCINSDALLYSKAEWWTFEESPGIETPQVHGTRCCPSDCGLCDQHLSGAVLAQIDLTNRCNLSCPVCFANAGVTGRVVEPDYEQIIKQLKALRDLRPIPCTAVQFTGGEPTIHPDFLRIVSSARDMGFSHIQLATNGLKMANPDFARQAADAGVHTLYLQFDGVGEEPHRHTRNHPGIWAKKLAAIENCRAIGLKVCLVPTILKGVNDAQVAEIFRFAVANIDVVSGISYQPVSFTGRIPDDQRESQRYTLGDLAHDIASASGANALKDMYPLSIVVPLAQFLEALTGKPKIRPSCHPDCAFGTYFLVSPQGQAVPFPQVIDVEGMFWDMNRLAARIKRRGRATWLDRFRAVRLFRKHFRPENAPEGLTVSKFTRSLQGLVDKNVGRGQGQKHTYKTLLCAGMHFQDRWNFDAERAKRCVILYSTPAGIFPFCTYNCGPFYRGIVETALASRTAGNRRDAKTLEAKPIPAEK